MGMLTYFSQTAQAEAAASDDSFFFCCCCCPVKKLHNENRVLIVLLTKCWHYSLYLS